MIALVMAAITGCNGGGESGDVERYSSEAFAFDHPAQLEVAETRDGQHFVRMERLNESGQVDVFLEALVPLEPTFRAASGNLWADPDDPDLLSHEVGELDLASASRASLERFTSTGVDGDRTFDFLGLVAEAEDGRIVDIRIGVDVDSDIDIDQLEEVVLGSLTFPSATEDPESSDAAHPPQALPAGYERVQLDRVSLPRRRPHPSSGHDRIRILLPTSAELLRRALR